MSIHAARRHVLDSPTVNTR